MTNNKYVLTWIEEMAAITKPDKIVQIDGTEEQAGNINNWMDPAEMHEELAALEARLG